jgi:hypothetical protein
MGYLHPKSEVMRVRTAGAVAVMAAMLIMISSHFGYSLPPLDLNPLTK